MIISAHSDNQGHYKHHPAFIANKVAYAHRHGYNYTEYCKTKHIVAYEFIEPGAWSKIYRIWSCLDEAEKNNNPLLWVDGDAVFNMMNKRFEELLEPDCCVIAHRDRGLQGPMFNSGVLLFRNASCARPMLMFAHHQRKQYRNNGLWEQTPLNMYAQTYPQRVCFRPIQTLVKFSQDSKHTLIHHFTMATKKFDPQKYNTRG
jgi:hypothetical protein